MRSGCELDLEVFSCAAEVFLPEGEASVYTDKVINRLVCTGEGACGRVLRSDGVVAGFGDFGGGSRRHPFKQIDYQLRGIPGDSRPIFLDAIYFKNDADYIGMILRPRGRK